MKRIERSVAVLALSLAALVWAFILFQPTIAAPLIQTDPYRFGEQVNTQSGAAFVDADGTRFLLGRSTVCGCLVVYADGVRVLQAPEAYGAPSGSIRADGMLEVGAMDRDQRTWRGYVVAGWDRVSFITRAVSMPMVNR